MYEYMDTKLWPITNNISHMIGLYTLSPATSFIDWKATFLLWLSQSKICILNLFKENLKTPKSSTFEVFIGYLLKN